MPIYSLTWLTNDFKSQAQRYLFLVNYSILVHGNPGTKDAKVGSLNCIVARKMKIKYNETFAHHINL